MTNYRMCYNRDTQFGVDGWAWNTKGIPENEAAEEAYETLGKV